MKIKNLKKRSNFLILNIALCVMLIFVFSCDSGGSGGAVFQTGSVAFDLALKSGFANLSEYSQIAQLNCEESLIKTVEAEVINVFGESLAGGGPWDCELGEGTIADVEAGAQRTVRAIARGEDDIILFMGESEPITVIAGQTTHAGTIELSPFDTVAVTFDFEELTPTYIDIDGGDDRPGALTNLTSMKSGITIDVFREGNIEFDTVDNTSALQILKPVVEFGNVSLDPFADLLKDPPPNSAFIVNFSVPVSSVSVAMGDYNSIFDGPPQDDDVLTLEAYSLANATGTLLDGDQIDLPDTPAPAGSFSFETLFVAATGECIRSILMIGGSVGIGPNSVFYDSIVAEAPCESSNQTTNVSHSPTSFKTRDNVKTAFNYNIKGAGGFLTFDRP
jgi:hypothetical protein